MHPRHGDDEAGKINWLTNLAVGLLLVLLVGAAIRVDLRQVPDDDSPAILLQDGTAPQPVATAQRRS
jgi:hypothetical protein